nr:MAG TPA: hypothetical protein [Caudoviricetes sp.]
MWPLHLVLFHLFWVGGLFKMKELAYTITISKNILQCNSTPIFKVCDGLC